MKGIMSIINTGFVGSGSTIEMSTLTATFNFGDDFFEQRWG
jgi:hypothetical protein